ncbi:DNA polymerase III subunit gamma/tau [Vibrio sagamiensis]|uniref:DNA polymerase III subunit gamma/tau n=1 Tax=Vibrio sagamiensis NBRC 104589 TaxID=1219064 RepID=A0A511QAY8_9VIBR|nr:DNA polymerase III subunit gamma/tau [Vibrio sagamiensis]PNQ65674.1 DNA polymerase III subunit gamma/tau [Vibrio agarivorans]GEM74397.1 DNA polymerase III subunit gamma/tau [Vibrio sagamiensis NBRC 104589]
MSYLALARKWRPHTFEQVVGQSHVLTALENALAQNRLHHAYLFSGTRGVGKTTIGRLFAKGLNCETGITSTPCGQCDTCREIDEGRFVDLLEIDAASRTKVEDTRELLDNVQYKPARGRFKVYLIDEVHMLSRHSFNALLKTLEEPPEYVKFLLATTDPQKLPVTILSRCLQFHLKPISVDDIHQQLDRILEKEQVSAEVRAIGMISHAADGSMRDALSLTDQAIALGNGAIQTDSVSHMLGTIDTDQAIHLLEAISSKLPQQAMDTIEQLAANGVDWDGLLQQLSAQLHRVAMCQALPSTLDRTRPDAEKIELLSKNLTPQDVQLYYQIALKGRDDLPLAPNGRTGIEMIVLRMMAFRPAEHRGANVISTASQPQTGSTVPPQVNTQVTQPSHPSTTTQVPSQASQPAYQSNRPTMEPQAQNHAPQMPSDYSKRQNMAPPHDPTAAEESAPVEHNVPPAPDNTPARSSLNGLRHQLRSQRQGQQQQPAASGGPKKSSATSAQKESVIDRLSQLHSNTAQVSPKLNSKTENTSVDEDEAYRWRPMKPVEKKATVELTPTQIKQALSHEKTPEMIQKLVDESLEKDSWAKLISQMQMPKLVEQLALNSSFTKEGSSVSLHLRNQQAHLNTDKAQSELLQALNTTLGETCHLSVEVGESGETPLELRDRLYQEKLQQAVLSLENDPHVQFIERRFAAELDKDSIRPI